MCEEQSNLFSQIKVHFQIIMGLLKEIYKFFFHSDYRFRDFKLITNHHFRLNITLKLYSHYFLCDFVFFPFCYLSVKESEVHSCIAMHCNLLEGIIVIFYLSRLIYTFWNWALLMHRWNGVLPFMRSTSEPKSCLVPWHLDAEGCKIRVILWNKNCHRKNNPPILYIS